MKSRGGKLVLLIGCCSTSAVESFAPAIRGGAALTPRFGRLHASPTDDDGAGAGGGRADGVFAETSGRDGDGIRGPPPPRSPGRRARPAGLAVLTGLAARLVLPNNLAAVPPANAASAPIVLRPSMKKEDTPMVKAMKTAEELKRKRSFEEFDAFMAEANRVESAEGKSARAAYERKYEADKAAREAQLVIDVEDLKRDLLDRGMDPIADMDAERQVFLLEHGVDLEKISGTPQNEAMARAFMKNRGKKVDAGPKLVDQRYIVSCQVADLKARGVDPLVHFSDPDVAEKTRGIYKMEDRQASRAAAQYRELMERYGGRLTEPRAGEVPFVRPARPSAGDPAEAGGGGADDGEAARAKAKAEKAAARARRAAEKEAARAKRASAKLVRSETRAAAKAEKATAREAAREERRAARAAAKAGAAAAATAATAAASSAASDAEAIAATILSDEDPAEALREDIAVHEGAPTPGGGGGSRVSRAMTAVRSRATAGNAAKVVVGGGAAVYGFNYYSENNAAAAADRERQLKLILGGDDEDDDDYDDDDDEDEDDDYEAFMKSKSGPPKASPASKPAQPKAEATPPPPAPTPPPPAPRPAPKPKKKLGIFARRKADARETDLAALVSPGAEAPEFATLLAQILTFGAPGRFPDVADLGPPPLETFDLDGARGMLAGSRSDLGLSDERSAEIFANVVNCMIIDIVDLAMSPLRGKDRDEKVAVDAINVVMDFMDHAASIFDAVAEGVTIKPVTYGGSLRRKDLEQMFSVYAGSTMGGLMSMDGGGATQDRVDTLQLVFGITDKKAEGLMQKHMMKTMMNMMKNPDAIKDMPGMEGMEEMMKMMGGEGGLPGMGMPGMDGADLSPEELKQTVSMMKELMDSGQVSEAELDEIRKQFREMYGDDISTLIGKAEAEGGDSMSDDEKALLDMFKQILGE